MPFDFDYAGLVDAHYAVTAKALNLPSVRERLYRGPCQSEAELDLQAHGGDAAGAGRRAAGPPRGKEET